MLKALFQNYKMENRTTLQPNSALFARREIGFLACPPDGNRDTFTGYHNIVNNETKQSFLLTIQFYTYCIIKFLATIIIAISLGCFELYTMYGRCASVGASTTPLGHDVHSYDVQQLRPVYRRFWLCNVFSSAEFGSWASHAHCNVFLLLIIIVYMYAILMLATRQTESILGGRYNSAGPRRLNACHFMTCLH